MDHKVLIVIIGRNEQRHIGKCIDAAVIAARQVGGVEMIYVDSHSTDDTVSVAQGYGVGVVTVDPHLRASPSAGRFTGTGHARGEFILFLDADTLIYPDFLPRALDYFQNDPTLGGVGGHMDDLNEAGELLTDIEERSDDVADVKWLRGPACFYRREALIKVGSFDPGLATEEEAELGLRLVQKGWGLKIIPLKMACHTRCHHGQSIKTLVSTFRRDIRSKRLGEITKTVAHAFRAGNGLSFCWLRLKTTIMFVAWLFAAAICLVLPGPLYPLAVTAALIFLGGLAIYAKKRSLSQTLLFIPSKVLNLIDLIAGLHKIGAKKTHSYASGNSAESLLEGNQVR